MMAGTESGPGPGEAESFRVRVSLERFFSDERARCYMSVCGARRVRWLARRLRRLFPLPRRLALLSRGHLLPPDEPLAILRPDDPVEVILATVEVNQLNEDKHSAIEDTIETSPLEHMESSPGSKRRRKDKQPWHNSKKPPVATDTTGTLPLYTGNYCSPEQESIELAQESKPTAEPSLDNKRRQNNKQYFYYEANCQQPGATDTEMTHTAPTEDIPLEQGSIEVSQECELSDSEKMRLLKEQALAVLDRVESRPRRRVRVRRRRRRPGDARPDWTVPDAPDVTDVPNAPDVTDVPNAPDAPDVPDAPYLPNALDVIDAPDASDPPDGWDAPDTHDAPVDAQGPVATANPDKSIETVSEVRRAEAAWAGLPGLPGLPGRPAPARVQRNAAAAPRAARLVRCVP